VAERWFLELDGIAGESTVVGHEGELDVVAWSWGVTHAGAPPAGGGAGAGKATFQDLLVTTRISKASPPLFLACATGRHLRTAKLSGVRDSGGPARDVLRYELDDVTVTSVQHGDNEESMPTERLALRYSKLRVTYVPQTATGAPGPAVTAGFDVKANVQL